MDNVEFLLNRIEGQRTWGSYHLGQYYFKINTNRTKEYLGIRPTDETISEGIQQFLQDENYAAIFHEYIHYIHEMSTIIGNVSRGLEICAKSIFSNNFDKELKSCEVNNTTDEQQIELLAKIFHSQDVILGNSVDKFDNRKLINISDIQYDLLEVSVPYDTGLMSTKIEIPKLEFWFTQNQVASQDHLLFGKFYIYEGIAYELDREIDKIHRGLDEIHDSLRNTEYTVLRSLAKYVFPDVEKITFLSLASMSLQHLNCGKTFILFLERVSRDVANGLSQSESVEKIKEEISDFLLSKQTDFNDAQDEYRKVFLKRTHLYAAFGYIADTTKSLYAQRISNPIFEIDMVFSGNIGSLLSVTEICDYMYVFDDAEPFMRDFMGTNIDQSTSVSLKILLSYDHYHKAHLIAGTKRVESRPENLHGERKCPFFHCCNLTLRSENAEICEKKPWRIFEVSAESDKLYCWYGTGVAEFKSHTEK